MKKGNNKFKKIIEANPALSAFAGVLGGIAVLALLVGAVCLNFFAIKYALTYLERFLENSPKYWVSVLSRGELNTTLFAVIGTALNIFVVFFGLTEADESVYKKKLVKIDIPKDRSNSLGVCPKCGKPVLSAKDYYVCSKYGKRCDFSFLKTVHGAQLSENDAKVLLSGKATGTLKMVNAKGQEYNARLIFNNDKKLAYYAPQKARAATSNSKAPAVQESKPVAKPVKVKSEPFAEIVGYEQTKAELMDVINGFLHKDLYEKAGAEMPNGILFYGPPGTGKTSLAESIAKAVGVPFYNETGSGLVKQYVGTGAMALDELYGKAEKNAPSIVFIDEIDAIARRRGGDDNPEYRNTFNHLLTKLDGIDSSGKVLTIFATNKKDELDEAFLRSKRCDKKIFMPLPNLNDRYEILKFYAQNKTLSDVDLMQVAKETEGMSGADLKVLLNSAASSVALKGGTITREVVEKELFKMLTGGLEGMPLTGEELKITAYHEAGHAVVFKKLCDATVSRVTVYTTNTGNAGTTNYVIKEEGLRTRVGLENQIKGIYGGRAAEEIYFGNSKNVTAGCAADKIDATEKILEYINTFGIDGEDSLLNISLISKGIAQEDNIKKAEQLSKRLYQETLEYLKANKETLDRIAQALIDKKKFGNEEIDELLKGDN